MCVWVHLGPHTPKVRFVKSFQFQKFHWLSDFFFVSLTSATGKGYLIPELTTDQDKKKKTKPNLEIFSYSLL